MDTSQPKLTDLWIEVNGLRTYARVCTSAAGPPVVLVHGLGVSGPYLLPTAERLAAYYPTYVPDLPGFGKTAKPDHILNVPELSDALAAWMKTVGVADACLLGNSMGCQTIIDLALRIRSLRTPRSWSGPRSTPMHAGSGRKSAAAFATCFANLSAFGRCSPGTTSRPARCGPSALFAMRSTTRSLKNCRM